MRIVKLTFNYDWPIFRQTPKCEGVWGDYKFVIDENLKECDFWVVYTEYRMKHERVRCNPQNTMFIPAESYSTSAKYSQEFLDQFGMLVTVQRELKHRNIRFIQNGNPWFVNKTYDELLKMPVPKKTKLISFISSDKASTEGQRKRLNYMNELKKHFGDQIDYFGRGMRDFHDKWDVLSDYKYSIAIENDYCMDWVTEKFFDCIFAYTYPIYYGCPNLEKYLTATDCFTRIDINNVQASINTIKRVIDINTYESKIEEICAERIHSLNKNTLFPLLVSLLDEMRFPSNKRWILLQLNTFKPQNAGWISSIKRKLRRLKDFAS